MSPFADIHENFPIWVSSQMMSANSMTMERSEALLGANIRPFWMWEFIGRLVADDTSFFIIYKYI